MTHSRPVFSLSSYVPFNPKPNFAPLRLSPLTLSPFLLCFCPSFLARPLSLLLFVTQSEVIAISMGYSLHWSSCSLPLKLGPCLASKA